MARKKKDPPPENQYSILFAADKLYAKELDGCEINEKEPLPELVCCGGEGLAEQVDFSKVWNAMVKISKPKKSLKTKKYGPGKIELTVCNQETLFLKTYFEGKEPKRTIKLKVRKRVPVPPPTPEEKAKKLEDDIKFNRKNARDYFASKKIEHARIGKPVMMFNGYPQDWEILVMLWHVKPKKDSKKFGCWLINGNFPIDHISCKGIDSPREALFKFAEIWAEVADCTIKGKKHRKQTNWCGVKLEDGDYLKKHATHLKDFATDDANWEK